ncbi:nucleic acid/nucleotide deaminase domain-containing protein [Aspergillus affinis]|uniref:nucleic acid/nucleotide deaminase domain-containing protein n=1 Tax=Aspergillus affinis TaxID=1070780 RepID=UPI0022FDC706|nr:uncharacterized protein KD926_011591 [Aspergillus affinis]KAI9037802.1 hypothetical protein KD926_011591 [Aspergillus affinis]
MPKTIQGPATACAEAIALSSFFYEVPASASRNTADQFSKDQKDYVLPFSKERQLTEVLAFLAKTKDGWDHIPAVCVQQNSSGTILYVILAINKTTWADGNVILQDLKMKFDGLFHILHHSNFDKSEIQKEVFVSIISICSPRILHRLRVKRNANKTSIQDLLKEAKFGVRRIGSEKLHSKGLSATSSLFISEADKVIRLVDRWLRHQNMAELGDLVDGIHHLQQTIPRLYELVESISNKDMGPSARASLVNIVRKVSRYCEAARTLYRTAKKFPLVRNMQIQLASLLPKAFESQIKPNEFSNLDSYSSRLGFKGQQHDMSQLCHNLKLNEKDARARHERAQKALVGSKIHAEIQVIAFCELQAPQLFPRVVSSSKDACFLCNTFIQLYGRMHTPKTHGRLYPGWRLPVLPQFRALQQDLNKQLIANLKQTISLGLAQGKLPARPPPNESTLLTLSASETTVEHALETPESGISSLDSPTITLSESSPESGPSLVLNQLSSTRNISQNSSTIIYPPEGKPVNGHMKHNRPFRLFATESLEVHLGLECGSVSTKTPLMYSIERLTADSVAYLSDTYPVVDAWKLKGEILCPLSENNTFCLAAGKVVLKISLNSLGYSEDVEGIAEH